MVNLHLIQEGTERERERERYIYLQPRILPRQTPTNKYRRLISGEFYWNFNLRLG